MKVCPVGAEFRADGHTHTHTHRKTNGRKDRHDAANSSLLQFYERT